MTLDRRNLERFGWAVAAYNLFVILFGAWVRITGSGAGCGDHWPTCKGEIVPLAPTMHTIIEYTHRLTTGLETLMIIGLAVAVHRFATHRKDEVALRWVLAAIAFLVVEAGVGALLVNARLVADDARPIRGVVVGLHLVNTLLLTAALALIPLSVRTPTPRNTDGAARWPITLAGISFALICATGAVTALGDTLFPLTDGSIADRLAQDAGPAVHIFRKLRIVHPITAVAVAGGLLALSARVASSTAQPARAWFARALGIGTLLQTALGFVNISLGAPGWMQIVHLAAAFVVWLALVGLWWHSPQTRAAV